MKIVCPPHQYDHVPLVLEMHLHTHTLVRYNLYSWICAIAMIIMLKGS